jgi:acetoin utilization deacetylase AcuC-like enzyme
MTTKVFSHPDIFLHDAAAQHCAMETTRIRRIYDRVSAVSGVELAQPYLAGRELFELNHTNEFVSHLFEVAPQGEERYEFDGETVMNRHTLRALQLSVGAVCQAVEEVLSARATNAFSVGYAGHHATPDRAMGFCFVNSVAIAARYALARGVQRIAVVDFDTHSGNGTVVSFFEPDERVMFAETYQPGFPGAFLRHGAPPHILREKCKSAKDFAHAWTRLLRKLAAHRPELILASAGFDAHMTDPLGVMGLADSAYSWIGRELVRITPRIVATLEGGYNVDTTARCASLFVSELVRAGAGK